MSATAHHCARISSVERMVAQALLDAERHVAEHLTRGLDAGQRQLLDALLLPHAGTNLSVLAWVRQPPGKPGRKTFAAIIERLTLLRAIGIDPDIAAGVHPERLRRLCQEGARLTAQHVRTLQATRRRATLVATILEIIVTLTDDAVLMLTACLANRNIIYEGTLSNTFYARQNSEYLRASSYRVEIDGMAVDPDLSHPRTYNRRAAQIAASPTGFGRGVGDKFHDDAVAGLVSTIKALQDEGKGPDIAGR